MQTETPMDTHKIIAKTLTHAIQEIRKENQNFQGRYVEAVKKIATEVGTTAKK